jgi:hypothetical protein
MAPSGVNDSWRAGMGALKRFWDRINGAYASTGSSNAYVLTPTVALDSYATGERYSFRANFANTGAATLNISSLGAKTIKKMTAAGKADLAAGDIQNGQSVTAEYDGTDLLMVTPTAALTAGNGISFSGGLLAADASFFRGYLSGLTLSNNATTPNTKVDIAAGVCVDSGNAVFMKSASTLTVDFGTTGANGLDTGTIAASKVYHIWAIAKTDGTIAGFANRDDLTGLSPTLPSGYSYKRRLGSVRTDASSHILAFTQNGDEFLWSASVADVSVTNLGTTATLYSLSVPTGVKVNALFHAFFAHSTVANVNGLIQSPDEADGTAANGSIDFQTQGAGTGGAGGSFNRRTDTSGRIKAVSNTASSVLRVNTYGWIDTRGRFD